MKNRSKGFQIIVTTADKSLWTIKTFAYLFNIYYSAQQDVHLICESPPRFRLPQNFVIHPTHLNGITGWPRDRWTDGLVRHLNSINEQYVLIMLDDYWISRTVDTGGIMTLLDYMISQPNLLRVDLTGDRLYAGGVRDIGAYGHFDIVEAKGSDYQMSLMPGLWNKKLLLEILQPNWTPWEVELEGTTLVNRRPELKVVGTRQWPIRIVNGLRDKRECVDVEGIDEIHLDKIRGWLERPICGEEESDET